MVETALVVATSATGIALINKLSDAMGWYFEPKQIERIAKAEVRARKGIVESDLEIEDIALRAKQRRELEEIRHQANLESTVVKLFPHLRDDASPEDMEDDWLVNVLDKCRIVSDDTVQELWARIIAGEANKPGSFSRKTVNMMSDLSRSDAELFERLCCFVWSIDGTLYPLTLSSRSNIYTKHRIFPESIQHLTDLGLITEMAGAFAPELGNEDTVAEYFGKSMKVGRIKIGNTRFSQAGLEIYEICNPSPVDGFFDYVVRDRWNLFY